MIEATEEEVNAVERKIAELWPALSSKYPHLHAEELANAALAAHKPASGGLSEEKAIDILHRCEEPAPEDLNVHHIMYVYRALAPYLAQPASRWMPIESAPKNHKIEAWCIAQQETITVQWCESRECFYDYRDRTDKMGEASFNLSHWREVVWP